MVARGQALERPSEHDAAARAGATCVADPGRIAMRALTRTRGARARRSVRALWAHERTRSWMNRFRTLLVRWDKGTANDLASQHVVCAQVSFTRAGLLG
jgi:hypothetical protein